MSEASQRPQVVPQVIPVTSDGERFQALAIREVVFIEEQHVPEGMERDDEDAQAFHVLALQGGHAIGTGRLSMLAHGPEGEPGRWGQIGRMAVLQGARGAGVGTLLLKALEEEARRREAEGISLRAQLTALEFYKKHGYQPVGPVFKEMGMDHLQMHKKFK